MYVLYIQISHMIAFAAPKNNEFTTLKIALLTDKKFCEVVLAVYVGCHSIKLHRSESISSFAIT